jgi:class 3 adenylate cyclase
VSEIAEVRPAVSREQASELRLLLEELCSDLCRFIHFSEHGIAPEDVCVDREVWLGAAGTFADIRVRPLGRAPYVIEVKIGYSDDVLVRHLGRKYGARHAPLEGVERLLLVVDVQGRASWERTLAAIRAAVDPAIAIEVWDEPKLLARLDDCFSVRVGAISPAGLLDARSAIDRAKGYYAFGGQSLETYEHDPLKAELCWHFSFWRLQQLRAQRSLAPREIMPPGLYRGVVVLLADLCSFSSYMRDTADARVTRETLTAFYSKARYQIINRGGMLYQFVGDEVIGLFGIPEEADAAADNALETACGLASIGASVADSWQRQIDRVQDKRGLHIGMAVGDVQIVSLRPYSRTHVGALGDCINVAARLMGQAGPGEIVATNSLVQRLSEGARARFTEAEPMEAKNVGRINAWKTKVECGT